MIADSPAPFMAKRASGTGERVALVDPDSESRTGLVCLFGSVRSSIEDSFSALAPWRVTLPHVGRRVRGSSLGRVKELLRSESRLLSRGPRVEPLSRRSLDGRRSESDENRSRGPEPPDEGLRGTERFPTPGRSTDRCAP
ncbi:MAG TPA: hypothetical protein VNE42_02365 [Acidimicrobiales bacterium]|nr:hypothetical protein [Acidimicrobiales bacterium]